MASDASIEPPARTGAVDQAHSAINTSRKRRPPALQDASFVSQWTFNWTSDLLRRGMAKPLDDEDLPGLLEEDTSTYNRAYVEDLWRREQQRAHAEAERRRTSSKGNRRKCRRGYGIRNLFRPAKPSLYHALIGDYFARTWWAQVVLVASMAARLGQSLALGLLIQQFANDEDVGDGRQTNTKRGYIWSGTLIGCGIVFLFAKQQQFFITHRKGMTMRLGLLGAIHSKALTLSSIGSATSISSGQMVNLASNDVERYSSGSPLMIYFIYAPIEALAILATGCSIMGSAFAAGFGLLLVFIPLQLYLARQFASLRSKVAAITDARCNLVSQACQGVRIMKMHGWENKFAERIEAIRAQEMNKIIKASEYKSLNEAINFSTTVAVGVVTFSVHVWAGGTLSSRIVFSSLSLINILQSSATRIFSNAVMHLSECYVSSRRIQTFFETPDVSDSPDRVDWNESYNGDANESLISLEDVTCYWDEPITRTSAKEDANDEPFRPALSKINLSLHPGRLYCVIGPVGSGKSALLQCIVGELRASSGMVMRKCTPSGERFMSYAQQESFIMDGTVRDNILFGSQFAEKWYLQVVHACGLSRDLEQLLNGDATIVGDRGVQLSGGQRARIGLARAIYRDASVVVLDDPLSAVDAIVGRQIFYNAITELCIARHKCVVLATHQHQYIGESTCVLVLDGKIQCQGSYVECIHASDGQLEASFQTCEDDGPGQFVSSSAVPRVTSLAVLEEVAKDKEDNDEEKRNQAHGVAKEERNTGIIKWKTWKEYAMAMGGSYIAVILFVLYCATQASSLVTIFYLGEWAESPANEQTSSSWVALVYGLMGALIFFSLIRTRLTYYFCLRASQRLHDAAIEAVLRAKVEFFDINPLGRILNRFSADVGIADDQLPLTLVDFLVGVFIAIGSVATAIVSLPMTLLALPVLLWYFIRLRKIFVTTTRELKRLEGLARSPIYAMIGEALSGVATMRANDSVGYFQAKFANLHDGHGRAFFAFVAASRWFAIRMDFIAFVFMSLTSLLAVLFQDQDYLNIPPAVLGMCLTLLLQMAGTNFPWMVRQSAEVVNQMVSVERVNEYGNLLREADLSTDHDDNVGDSWPEDPSISTSNLTVRYRASIPPALKGISFEVKSGQRVGICGRTGSGKSSLVQALFRLLEVEEGTIQIGGVDISKLGLHKLRQSMSVIPQSPVLFSGTSIRFNLDPFSVYPDKIIRAALADAQILDTVDELPGGLDSIVAEAGSNFSVGQRQLLCLARAILRKSKILILDESGANIDNQTDALLHQTVSTSFRDATILSVAHRLGSIIDHDLVLVLGDAKVLEYGPPAELLSKISGDDDDISDAVEGGSGHFASMVDATGDRMAKSLRKSAILGPIKRY